MLNAPVQKFESSCHLPKDDCPFLFIQGWEGFDSSVKVTLCHERIHHYKTLPGMSSNKMIYDLDILHQLYQ